ncbi:MULTISPECIES: WYL domain-containing protein [Legionella]|uniref:WYL domain-containing protein n=1 Tax=Legionella septentrionalis TaxID=2498109 RepID=A0A433JLW1_9GAMM|nr:MULTISPECIES: hypothetical protein [Legionella]MCP0914841.1 hypothetical protein [Legionella sp. 27cVA30]RUQ91024.1 hypothetical protein EKM59_00655 [Legionella septentrionalis]RUR02906.1 hypothetical protein ELY11_00690 [Legionella septentrionalis]RUR11505.1 hypothetical protein ELY14_01800 [Legionella septentrionalis]RUR16770.1 hypothetical protein ELY10_02515 [Legionella septentrionalis]
MLLVKNQLKQAMASKNTVSFIYKGKPRTVEPYHYGQLGGKEQLHCYQIRGESNSRVPEWKNFMLAKIQQLTVNFQEHFTIRNSYKPSNSHYTTITQAVHTSHEG